MKVNGENYIEELQKGNEDALNFIVDMYLPMVKGITYKVLGKIKDLGAIDECVNDIFISIWNNSSKFKGDNENFKSWIYKISKFKAIDYYRKLDKINYNICEDIHLGVVNGIEEDILLLERRNELIKLINKLDDLDRDIFLMKFYLGFDNGSIAKEKGITKAAVENRIYRGKKRLKEGVLKRNLEVVL